MPGPAILVSLHEAGISHGDLRCNNILMGRDGRAFFIDFATAARLRQGGLDAWFSRRMFYYVRRIDRVTFARINSSYSPYALDETERAWLADDPWHLRFGRWFKRHVYRLRKPGVIRHRLFFLWTWILSRLGLREKARRYR